MQIVTSSAVVLSAFGREGNIFSTCCNTGDFMKVTITAISSCLLHRLFNFPKPGVRRNFSGTSGGRLSVRQERKLPT